MKALLILVLILLAIGSALALFGAIGSLLGFEGEGDVTIGWWDINSESHPYLTPIVAAATMVACVAIIRRLVKTPLDTF